MASELSRRPHMQSLQERPDYLGALIEEERRLVLVSVNPDEPWDAFRRLRRVMRRDPRRSEALIDIYETDTPLEHKADVIEISSRRRAG